MLFSFIKEKIYKVTIIVVMSDKTHMYSWMLQLHAYYLSQKPLLNPKMLRGMVNH